MLEPAKKSPVVPENLEAKKRRIAFNKVLRTEEGQIFWAYLHEKLGWNTPILHVSRVTGDLAPISTEAAAALRDTYLEMRRIPERELVIKAEEIAEVPPAPAAAKPETPKEK